MADHQPTLIVTLGMHGSGSTWIYNVVRMLLEAAHLRYTCLATESGLRVLDAELGEQCFTVVKAHGLDLRMLRLVSLCRSRLIVSTRDPRDSAVSQIQRFNASLGDAVGDLSRALSSIEIIPDYIPRLAFKYEERFMDSKYTIRRIADFLGIPVRRRSVTDIFEALRPEVVRQTIAAQPAIASGAANQDPVTQWNRNHVGDGRSGKWLEHLSLDHARAVETALTPLAGEGAWRRETVHWSSELFRYDEDVFSGEVKTIDCDGAERVLVFGPYLHLPAGRWRVVVHVGSPDPKSCHGLSADIYLPMYDRHISTIRIDASLLESGAVEFLFDHTDHFESVELRICAEDQSTGSVCFSGATLFWMGPPEPALLTHAG